MTSAKPLYPIDSHTQATYHYAIVLWTYARNPLTCYADVYFMVGSLTNGINKQFKGSIRRHFLEFVVYVYSLSSKGAWPMTWRDTCVPLPFNNSTVDQGLFHEVGNPPPFSHRFLIFCLSAMCGIAALGEFRGLSDVYRDRLKSMHQVAWLLEASWAEMICNSSNGIHQTWCTDFSQSLYRGYGAWCYITLSD